MVVETCSKKGYLRGPLRGKLKTAFNGDKKNQGKANLLVATYGPQQQHKHSLVPYNIEHSQMRSRQDRVTFPITDNGGAPIVNLVATTFVCLADDARFPLGQESFSGCCLELVERAMQHFLLP